VSNEQGKLKVHQVRKVYKVKKECHPEVLREHPFIPQEVASKEH
jgi:hypothetical protein